LLSYLHSFIDIALGSVSEAPSFIIRHTHSPIPYHLSYFCSKKVQRSGCNWAYKLAIVIGPPATTVRIGHSKAFLSLVSLIPSRYHARGCQPQISANPNVRERIRPTVYLFQIVALNLIPEALDSVQTTLLALFPVKQLSTRMVGERFAVVGPEVNDGASDEFVAMFVNDNVELAVEVHCVADMLSIWAVDGLKLSWWCSHPLLPPQ
jgi:hypothetical protein